MRFVSIRIREGVFEKNFSFSEGFNLIHSEKNTRGKTTLLRFLLYSLGYPIPNTKNIRFELCEVESIIECELGKVILQRNSAYLIDMILNGETRSFILPSDHNELLGLIFNTENINILNNLLGAFYLDQEKGWTLLNRGKVIGAISFNIEELIRGISDRNCDALLVQQKKLETEKKRYKQLLSISQLRNEILEEQGSLLTDNHSEKEDARIDTLLMEQEEIRDEIKQLNASIRDNKNFIKFISNMRIYVRGNDGEEILVSPERIVGYADLSDILESRKKLLSYRLAKISRSLNEAQKEQQNEEEQLSFLSAESMLDVAGKRLTRVPLDSIAIERTINRIEEQIKKIQERITNSTKTNNNVVGSLYANIKKYAEELNLTEEKQFREVYLFTRNLKELSGAILHKTVFTFRLAYIIEIEKALGIKLPIILDSPSGKEVDLDNINLMINILKRDFSDHQIIIASIFEYNLDVVNRIELVNRLIE